ncbi:MAG TPA: hypothetical protein VM598_09685 [Bdellovibrionota bacterium]|nr:hypothetical protein [Bdellovibrionota bacterium]
MKTLRLSVLVSCALIALSGCGKDDPMQVPAAAVQPPSPEGGGVVTPVPAGPAKPERREDFVLSTSYVGPNLQMPYPNDWNLGAISLQGDDAKALFDALALKTAKLRADDTWLAGRKKSARDVACIQHSRRATPGKLEHECAFAIEFRRGSLQTERPARTDERVAQLQGSYIGVNLVMVTPHPVNFTVVRIRGEDARALFFTLNAFPRQTGGNVVYRPSRQKRGEDLECFETSKYAAPDELEYACHFYINYRTGEKIALGEDR